MGVILLKLGKPAPLPPDEHVVHEQRRFRAISSMTAPSYRIGFNLPPLWRISLVVTDRRCLLLTDLLHRMSQEVSMWYPGCNPSRDPETITSVCSTTGLLGPCLEIRSYDRLRRQRWLWSPKLTLRFFLRDPEAIELVILEQMAGCDPTAAAPAPA